MNKKHLIIRIVIILLLAAMMIPSIATRIKNEKINNDVVLSFNYNSAYQSLNEEELEAALEENKKIGVTAASIGEESLSTLISSGFLTCMNYKDIGTKYDPESEEISALLKDDKKIRMESFVIITKRPEAKAFLDKWINAKYTKDEITKKETVSGADVYVIYEGGTEEKKFAIGFNESKIENAYNHGFDISLTMMFGAFSNTKYIDYIRELVDKYDIKYINLKNNALFSDRSLHAEENYTAMCNLIKEKNLYLVLTENQNQLSNQRPVGYDKLIAAAEGRVLRSYETVDFKDADLVSARYHRILNSVVDRNLRMVIINQFTSGQDSYKVKSDKTNEATRLIIDKLESIGFNTKEYNTQYNYVVNREFTSAMAMMLMVVMAVTMLEILFLRRMKKLEAAGIILALFAGVFTFVAPDTLVGLYPTFFAMIAPCFALTVVMGYIKIMREKLSSWLLTITSVAVTVIVLSLCGFVQSALLSGLDYYINSLIFRGIKISLILPIMYSVAAYGLIFIEEKGDWMKKAVNFLNKEIRVYWVILGAGLMVVALIYLIRSGNVTSISPIEAFMRNSIADVMAARPRTKEFLIGWPALVLFVYYVKNSNIHLLKWGFAVGSSILFASVINSFCHVFTSAEIIYSRLFNGLLIGAVVSLFVILANAFIIKFVRWIIKKYNLEISKNG